MKVNTQRVAPKSLSIFTVTLWLIALLAFIELLFLGLGIGLRDGQVPSDARYLSNDADYLPPEYPPNSEEKKRPEMRPIHGPILATPQTTPNLVPRTVDELLAEAEGIVDNHPSPVPAVITPPPLTVDPNVEQQPETTPIPTPQPISSIDKLLKEARSAQIEGDMRRCILKLEEARGIEPEHPALLYFYGLAYEKLRNVEKAREFYTKVFTLREKAGNFFPLAARRLQSGFEYAEKARGKMCFGTIQEFREPVGDEGERVVLTVPIMVDNSFEIRPEDIFTSIQFFDIVDGKRIEFTRAEQPKSRWVNEPADWSQGEETLEIRYHMPVLSTEELTAYGELRYHGYTAKLFYKGEPMDCISSPNSLILTEQILLNKNNNDSSGAGPDSLLPPVEAEPMTEFDPTT